MKINNIIVLEQTHLSKKLGKIVRTTNTGLHIVKVLGRQYRNLTILADENHYERIIDKIYLKTIK